MRIIKYLSIFLAATFTLFINSKAYAQILDSIKYEYGLLYFHQYGPSSLPPVIILTGGPGNSYTQLEEMAKSMSTKFRCILVEQRGTGRSIPDPFNSKTVNVNSVTSDIKLLMENLHLDQAIIVGHSWGGMLAMNFAATFPDQVEHLVLLAPGPHKDARNGFSVLFTNRTHTRSAEEEQRLSDLNKRIAKNKADDSAILESKKLARRAYVYENPVPDDLFKLINSERNSKTEQLLIKDIYDHFDVSESLKNYKGPIDIISGRQDVVGFFSYEVKIDFPNANLHWINRCGHFPMYEQASEFYTILYEILAVK